jgi:hypothetical protein
VTAPHPTAPEHDRGILTLAYGSPRHVQMAIALARSLQIHAPDLPRAIITDSTSRLLAQLYDQIAVLQPAFGGGHEQKLNIDRYAPFHETLYIDADSLVVDPLTGVWPLFDDVPVGVVGSPMSTGDWFGDIAAIRSRLMIGAIPRFNGGFVFVRRTPEAAAVFTTARRLMERYEELGFRPMRGGGRNDEPILACALALHGITGVPDRGTSSRTPIGIRGPLNIDVIHGGASFNKEGNRVKPAIVHFCGWRSRGFHYRREALKLTLAARWDISPTLIARTVDALANPPYAVAAAFCRPPLRMLEQRHRSRGAGT